MRCDAVTPFGSSCTAPKPGRIWAGRPLHVLRGVKKFADCCRGERGAEGGDVAQRGPRAASCATLRWNDCPLTMPRRSDQLAECHDSTECGRFHVGPDGCSMFPGVQGRLTFPRAWHGWFNGGAWIAGAKRV